MTDIADRIGISTHFLPSTHGEDVYDAIRMVHQAGFSGLEIVPTLDQAQLGYPQNYANVGIDLFEARLDGESVVIKTTGRARVIYVTQPPLIMRPQYLVDGQEWMACWTDYPSSAWGTYENTWLIALSVPEGEHELLVREMKVPAVWTRQFEPLIEGVVE